MPFLSIGLNSIKFVFFRFRESLFVLNQADNLLSSELTDRKGSNINLHCTSSIIE